MVREVATMRLADAEAFFAVTVHRDHRGHAIPTVTLIAPGLEREHNEAIGVHVRAVAETLREAYAPKKEEGAKPNP